ncbi:MAG: 2-oxoacid:acceptor oxidoreductase family protein [Deltaproteobacteria bacterium]|nr:2-oxoacid:acceptor oxidoreductase family protein [Deltaproteobacteria bacterium]
MIEIRFHGRGGQGAVIASKILAAALFREGRYAQAFPAFGGERRGAPVMAFTRFDRRKITRRSQVYEPDHVIVLDESIFEIVEVTAGLRPGGWILINTAQPPASFSTRFGPYRIAAVDASRIAREHGLGSGTAPLVNTVILGAFARVSRLIGLEAVIEGIREYVPGKVEENVAAARKAHAQVSEAPFPPCRPALSRTPYRSRG